MDRVAAVADATPPEPRPSTRDGGDAERSVPSLDLLRSYAVFSVVTAHTVLAFGAPPLLAPLQLGGTGVDLFFVLSGWLLGRQLLLELRDTGTLSLPRFWSRRWLRTLPAYYAVLLATFLQDRLFSETHEVGWGYLVFLQNYDPGLQAFFVSWSLCVEEHFYLAVGPALMLLWRAGRWRVPIVLGLLAAPLAFRLAGWYGSSHETHVRFDECAVGVVLAAVAVFRPVVWSRLCRMAPWIGGAGLLLYGLSFWFRWNPELGIGDYDQGMYAWIFGTWVLLAVSSPWWRIHLYVPGARFLAKRAYAVYLLHPESLALVDRLDISSFPLFAVLTWIVTLAAAEVLYRAIERPFMDMRERFAVSRKPLPAGPHAVP